jgi:hypothetical protein
MLHIPNNMMVKQTLVNLTYPTRAITCACSLARSTAYRRNRVKDALMRATLQARGVEKHPPPQIFVSEYGESRIIYQIKFTMMTTLAITKRATRSTPTRGTSFADRRSRFHSPPEPSKLAGASSERPKRKHAQIKASLEADALFSCLTGEQLDQLIRGSRKARFGRGEKIIEQDAEGDSMFVLLHGAANVSVSQNGSMIRVGSLQIGDCFGEMSLLTGREAERYRAGGRRLRSNRDLETGNGFGAARRAGMPPLS